MLKWKIVHSYTYIKYNNDKLICIGYGCIMYDDECRTQ